MLRLTTALANHPERTSADAILFLLLTGARRSEALCATWDQFDLENGVWVKPSAHTKQRKTHRVPLSSPALALLRQRAAATNARYAFPGADPERPLTDVKRTWAAVCLAAGLVVMRPLVNRDGAKVCDKGNRLCRWLIDRLPRQGATPTGALRDRAGGARPRARPSLPRALRVEQELRLRGLQVSSGGIRGVWMRHGLLTSTERLLRLERTTAERTIELTEEQVQALERFSPEFRERHIEAPHTGALVAVDTFFVGTLKAWARSTCRRDRLPLAPRLRGSTPPSCPSRRASRESHRSAETHGSPA